MANVEEPRAEMVSLVVQEPLSLVTRLKRRDSLCHHDAAVVELVVCRR